MSKKIEYLTGCLSAAEHLRVDAESGKLLIYDIPNFPSGVIPSGYLEKCSSVVVGLTGSGNFDYIVAMPIRPDRQKSGSAKDIDIDPVVFCFKRDDLESFPTGVALRHQDFPGRTSPLSGYETFTVEQTVQELRTQIVTGYYPVSSSADYYTNAISHSVAKLNELVGSNINAWWSASNVDPRDGPRSS
jgi:hypothetical protein